ncbi:protein tweety isoform X2 [Bemisia tabaci]|uniref:protein tweety isoform X2 n=1 Tax=Bemisia tabaci TaxID=7038 RepID=UPI0008F9C694|nr:PREDICTED: protein tweety isoform X2 [Bemisia tabaci]
MYPYSIMGTHYRAPPLARLFHAFPHLNVSLHLVNSTFAIESNIYLESLGILGSIPAAWLIITLFLLLIYLLTRCCDRKPRPKHSIVVLKWTLAIFTVLCCGAVGVSLYGNDDVHNGLLHFQAAVRDIDKIISGVRNQTTNIENTLERKIYPLLTELKDVFDNPIANQTARALLQNAINAMTGNRTASLDSCRDISRPLRNLAFAQGINLASQAETIRWLVTMGVLSVLLIFCVILLFGVARHSRCALILFSVFGLFAVIISWLSTSVYLATSVALGDICVAPDQVLEHESPSSFKSDILHYYTTCEISRTNPFTVVIHKATKSMQAMKFNLAVVSRPAKELYPPPLLGMRLEILTTEVNHVSEMIASLAGLVDCKPIHQQYMQALHAVCEVGLFGLALMLIASAAAGFFFTVLVWLDSHTWIYIRKKRKKVTKDEMRRIHTFSKNGIQPSAPEAEEWTSLRQQSFTMSDVNFKFSERNGSRRDISISGGGGGGGILRSGGPDFNSGGRGYAGQPGQYATLNRKFRTLEHPTGTRRGLSHLEPGNSHTLGHKKLRDGGGSQNYYSTISKKCKTLEANDFY